MKFEIKEMSFSEKILRVVQTIKPGEVKSYQEVARLAGKERVWRVVGNILAKNRAAEIPCHRVIKNDLTVGGYQGNLKNSWKKLALLLKEGVVAVMPTDTLYGLCGSALIPQTVEKIYRLKKRSLTKPLILLIPSLEELKRFKIFPTSKELTMLRRFWPGKVSIIFALKDKKIQKQFHYLHRGTQTLSFRLPQSSWLRKLLNITGPLVAPSANWEGYPPAETIIQAKRYFGQKVVYYNGRKLRGNPSTLIKLERGGKIKVLRGRIKSL